ncbi:sporulation inhibitor of replication protein SirA [Paraliobacillus quinghaiensis]|uniref:Sporulation inhibitor of replication protein SirA n=1 Tax=Paraliobacillus quinghaiensis TaxID=470815 RepID=A0A917WXE2_9BACI|nr:sporulation inhibitor of replication protein SirA [Paraliobacillus quinghaiensis]GGM37559.1 sporulation inhibitor of replication protein SirA [Paraliobacillus quinghaiensis]
MQKYYVFFLNKEVGYDFFYKPEVLCRFFQSYLSNQTRTDLSSQFMYITRLVSADKLLRCINKKGPKNRYVQNNSVVYFLKENASNTFAINDRWLEVNCESLEVANTMLFEWLEKYDHCCYIMEQNGRNYGWLSPIKKQALLS